MSYPSAGARPSMTTDNYRPDRQHLPTPQTSHHPSESSPKERYLESERHGSFSERRNDYRYDRYDPLSRHSSYGTEPANASMPRQLAGPVREHDRIAPYSPPISGHLGGDPRYSPRQRLEYHHHSGSKDVTAAPVRANLIDEGDHRYQSRQSLPSITEALGHPPPSIAPRNTSETITRGFTATSSLPPLRAARSPDALRRHHILDSPVPTSVGSYQSREGQPSPHLMRVAAPPLSDYSTTPSTSYPAVYASDPGRVAPRSTSSYPISASGEYSPRSAYQDQRVGPAQQGSMPKLATLPPLQTRTPPGEAPRPLPRHETFHDQISQAQERQTQAGHTRGSYAESMHVQQHLQQQQPHSAPPTHTTQLTTGHQGHVAPPSALSAPTYGSSWNPRLNIGELSRVEENKRQGRPTGSMYGQSVKRKLESFDYETSLHEIDKHSRAALDFSSHHSSLAHQAQRTGLSPSDIPDLQHVDDVIQKADLLREALFRVREYVMGHHVGGVKRTKVGGSSSQPAHEDDGGYESDDLSRANDIPPGQVSQSQSQSQGQTQTQSQSQSDATNGFAVPDPKKRRGRAAPPGRCHSCHRSETPEWRRGPDGARTLCNACGLHYAKLSRKMGAAKAAGMVFPEEEEAKKKKLQQTKKDGEDDDDDELGTAGGSSTAASATAV